MQNPGTGLLKSQREALQVKLKWFVRLALGLIIVGVLVRWQGANVGQALKSTSPFTLVIALGCYLITQMLSAFKWRLLLNAAARTRSAQEQGSRATQLSFWECYRFYLIGMFCNLWLPTAVGGDAIRAALAGKRCGSFALAASAIFVERLTGLAALLTIGVIGLLLHFGAMPAATADSGAGQSRAVGIAMIAVVLLVGIAFGIWLLRRLAANVSTRDHHSKWMQKLLSAHRAFDAYFAPATRPALFGALGLSFVFQSSQILLNAFLAGAVGLILPLSMFIWLIPSLGIASMLPLGIGGLGVREASAVTFLNGALPTTVPLDSGTIIAWSLLWQATLWLAGLPGALAYFAGHETPKLETAKEQMPKMEASETETPRV